MEKKTVKELVILARENDEKAIEELYKLTIRKATFLTRKYLTNDNEVDDVLQESYVTAFQKIDQLNDETKFESWLNMIIVRKCKDQLSKRKDVHFSELSNEEYKPEDFIENENLEFSPEDNMDYQELKSAMKDIIDELSIEQRMCIIMYYYQQYSIKEISEVLDTNENTIKSRLNYGKKKIAERISDLEAKGYKIRGIAPIPFMIWVLSQEEAATNIPSMTVPFSEMILHGTKLTGQVTKHVISHGAKIKILAGITATAIAGGTYYVYDQIHTVNLLENVVYEVDGSNHYGVIRIEGNSIDKEDIDVNMLIKGYAFSKETNLSNGDTISITVQYDEEYAKEHSLKVTGLEKEVQIDGLTNRYENKDQIEEEKIEAIHSCMLNKLFQEKRKNDGEYKIITDENETDRKYDNYEYFEVVMSYFAKAKDNAKTSDKYIVLLRHTYKDSKMDEELKKQGVKMLPSAHFIYADYHYIEVDNFYIESLNSENEIQKNISEIKDVELVDMLKEKFAKEKFKSMITNDQYEYEEVKNYINEYYQ